jgi:hypothetical protein
MATAGRQTVNANEVIEGDKLKIVIAPTYQGFVEWCKDNNMNPNDSRQVKCITVSAMGYNLRGYNPNTIQIIRIAWTQHQLAYLSDDGRQRLREIREQVKMYEALGAQVIDYLPRARY